MTEEKKMTPNYEPDENALTALPQDTENSLKQSGKAEIAKSNISSPALAIAVAALALPLIAIKDAKAQDVACSVDGFQGQDIGDPGDCADCTASMFPADCEFNPDGVTTSDPGDSIRIDTFDFFGS
jgi:hypothetical protein